MRANKNVLIKNKNYKHNDHFNPIHLMKRLLYSVKTKHNINQ